MAGQENLSTLMAHKPQISVVVVTYNIPREAPRTLLSLSASYQRDIPARDFEVVVVDNGSHPPLDPGLVSNLEGNFRLIRIDPAPPSPAYALNRGIAEARGDIIGVMVDGARIASPRMLHFALAGAQLYARPVVATVGYYIGYDYQAFAALAGYDAGVEDKLLEEIRWPADGYRLFDISTLDEGWPNGYSGASNPACVFESNALFARRESWELIGGVDERFAHPGGGLVNHDIYRRLVELPLSRLVVLLGEATFHQYHGGVATNADPKHLPERFDMWADEYRAIRGRDPLSGMTALPATTYVGNMRSSMLTGFVRNVIEPFFPMSYGRRPRKFDLFSWGEPSPSYPADPKMAALVKLMREEFEEQRYDSVVVIARLMRARAKGELEPLRLLRRLAPYDDPRRRRPKRDARFHLSVGKAYVLLGEPAVATEHFRTALSLSPECEEARVELARYL